MCVIACNDTIFIRCVSLLESVLPPVEKCKKPKFVMLPERGNESLKYKNMVMQMK